MWLKSVGRVQSCECVSGSSAQSVEFSPANGNVSGSNVQSMEFSPANGNVSGSRVQSVKYRSCEWECQWFECSMG